MKDPWGQSHHSHPRPTRDLEFGVFRGLGPLRLVSAFMLGVDLTRIKGYKGGPLEGTLNLIPQSNPPNKPYIVPIYTIKYSIRIVLARDP